MSYFLKSSTQRYQQAIDTGSGQCRCGCQLKYVGTARVIDGGDMHGQLKNVAQLYCPNCERRPVAPPHATRIDYRDVMDVVQVSPRRPA